MKKESDKSKHILQKNKLGLFKMSMSSKNKTKQKGHGTALDQRTERDDFDI